MPTYTAQIEAANHEHTIWQALAPAETVESDDTAAEVAADIARHQNIAASSDWRVRVWEGENADTGSNPAAEHVAGTSVNDLARVIAEQHGIDTHAAAREIVATYAGQVNDDADLWDDVTETLTPDGVAMVSRAVAEAYSVGAVATAAAQLLVQIEEAADGIAEQTARRDALIRQALTTELRRADIAAAARLTEGRLYQIRDGRR